MRAERSPSETPAAGREADRPNLSQPERSLGPVLFGDGAAARRLPLPVRFGRKPIFRGIGRRRLGGRFAGSCGGRRSELITDLHRAGERIDRTLAKSLTHAARTQRRARRNGDAERWRDGCCYRGDRYLDLGICGTALICAVSVSHPSTMYSVRRRWQGVWAHGTVLSLRAVRGFGVSCLALYMFNRGDADGG
jgi:hypothetical protein